MDLIEISDNLNRHPWELARKDIVQKWISEKIQQENISILDVGSGDAFLANSFTNAFSNSKAYCVDTGYTSEIINTIENNFENDNLKLYSSLNTVEINNIDVVTLLDVLEHTPDDNELLDQIISEPYINNDTYFIIIVPAYQTLFSKHDALLKHHRRYSLKKLKRTINQSGLDYLDGGYFFSSLLVSRIVQLIVGRIKSNNKMPKNLGSWTGGKRATNFIKNVLMLDFSIGIFFKSIGISLPGLSCYLICKKKCQF